MSRIERFVYFNETESELVVNGTLMTEIDSGTTWEILVEVFYEEPFSQIFRSQFTLHIGMGDDEGKTGENEEEKPSEFDTSERYKDIVNVNEFKGTVI